MRAHLFKFDILDFEEVYVVFDDEKKRLHISPVNYRFNMTLDLTKELNLEIKESMKFEEINFSEKAIRVMKKIIKELNLA